MKKLLAIIIATATIGAQAASMQWKATNVAFGGTTLDSKTATVSGYLVFLGTSSSLADLYTIDYTAPGTITPATNVGDPKSVGTGRAAGSITSTYDDATSATGDGSQVAAGNYFAMYLKYVDGKGDTWYNFATSAGEVTLDERGVANPITFSFNYGTQTTIESAGQTPSGWTKINVVPEPSTAMLALAGLALLIKRRRA